MKNLFLLKTEKHIKNVGDLVKDKYGDIHIFTKKDSKEYGKTIAKLNIYITSDEKIKDEDYFLNIAFDTVHTNGSTIDSQYCKKIILTTDQDLIKDGVQPIDDEFLEWFVKNPSCERVETVFNNRGITGAEKILKTFGEYKIIIPKEETNGCIGSNGVSDPKLNEVQLNQPKQETLEEVAKRRHRELSTAEVGIIPNFVDGFVEGYGSAQQQMYNELVDLLESLRPIYREDSDFYQKYDKQRLNFIEQLKKK